MKQIMGIADAGGRRGGTRVFCKKCQKETAFFRSKCLECGTAYMRLPTKLPRKANWADGLIAGRRAKQVSIDKRASLRAQAKESRAMFEGLQKKPENSVSETPTASYSQADVEAFLQKKGAA